MVLLSYVDEIFPLHWREDYLSAKKAKLGVKNKGEHLSQAASDKLKEEFIQELREAKCGVYTAESTIPMAGKGMYVSVTIPTENIDSVSTGVLHSFIHSFISFDISSIHNKYYRLLLHLLTYLMYPGSTYTHPTSTRFFW